MKPAVVFPINDLSGVMFRHLERVLPDLKCLFATAYLCIPEDHRPALPEALARLGSDDFFEILFLEQDYDIGAKLRRLYEFAAHACPDRQNLHLCFVDRIAFALETEHRDGFLEDIRASENHAPLLFQRSEAAWDTHPSNYFKIENMVTEVGKLLFGRSLDFAWCHVVVEARDLRRILPAARDDGFAMIATIILMLRNEIRTQDVDWLAWEDPLILGRDAAKLKAEREQSLAESRKRLEYALAMLQLLYRAAG